MFCFNAAEEIFFTALSRYSWRSSILSETMDLICWNAAGFEYLRLRSSSSFLTSFIPRRDARGAHMSITSLATSRCASGLTDFKFLMRSSLSASFISITRMSSTIAKSILRMASACCSELLFILRLVILEVWLQSLATSEPNSFSISS